MNISFFVSSILSAYWNGAATYYRGLARALHARGHELHFYEPDAFERQAHRDLDELPWGAVTVYDPHDRPALDRCLGDAARADFLVKAGGIGINDDYLEAAVAARRTRDNRIVFLDVDSPATLARVEADPADAFRQVLPEYDLVLCYGGGEPVCRRYRALGARRCDIVYNALDPTTHYPVPPQPEFAGDLGFLGNRLPDREARVREFFLEPADRLAGRRFVLGGSGWDDAVQGLPNLHYLGHVYTSAHNAFNLSPTAVINISRDDMARNGYAPATRVFEAAGAGACLITDEWQGIDQFLAPGSEVLVARNADDVVDLLEALDPGEARAIGRRARQRILGEHTYEERARQVESLLQHA